MQERRSDDRIRAFRAGRIAGRDGRLMQDCVVRDLSERGALLLVDAPRCAPLDFDLTLPPCRESRRARVVWRGEAMVGVAFVAATVSATAAVPATAATPAAAVPSIATLPSATVVSIAAARAARRPLAERARLAERMARASAGRRSAPVPAEPSPP